MDLSWLTWFVPLVLGAGLTFFFGWLDSTLKYRRQIKDASADRERAGVEQRRIEGREHAQQALELASRSRDQLEGRTSEHGIAVSWDRDLIRQLQDVGILIPDATVRHAIHDAANLVTASTILADSQGWELPPRQIQITSMIRLRLVLGSYLRNDPLDAGALRWLTENADALEEEWNLVIERDRELALKIDD